MTSRSDCNTTGTCSKGRACPGTWLLIGLLLVLAVQYVLRSRPTSGVAIKAGSERRPMGDLSLTDLEGKIWRLDEHRGRVVLINIWATWCPPCQEETPDLVKIAGEYTPRGVAFVGISTDEAPESVRRFVKSYGIPYPVAVPSEPLPLLEGISAIPVTILVDHEGRVAKHIAGAINAAELRADLDQLLSERPATSAASP